MTTLIAFDDLAFREQCPEFADKIRFTDTQLQSYWDVAVCYVSDVNYGRLRSNCRRTAINYMTAHLAKLNVMIQSNQLPGQVQGSGIDKVTVSMTPPPNPTQFHWWLGTTSYGQLLLALLGIKAVGGFYVGGRPETAAFRKVGGTL